MSDIHLCEISHQLFDSSGEFIAHTFCMQQLGSYRWLPQLTCEKGLCRACRKPTLVIDGMSASALRARLADGVARCFATEESLPSSAGPPVASMLSTDPAVLPQIAVVRCVDLANRAIDRGFYPVMICVAGAAHSNEAWGVFAQQTQQGLVQVRTPKEHGRNNGLNSYQGKRFAASTFDTSDPFYAYLVPRDLPIASRVWIAKLAHPVIHESLNNVPFALNSCEAIWRGGTLDFILPRIKYSMVIG
jgi:hypothetical protein